MRLSIADARALAENAMQAVGHTEAWCTDPSDGTRCSAEPGRRRRVRLF